MTKGNDGRAARRRSTKQLVGVSACSLIFVIGFLYIRQPPVEPRRGKASAGGGDGRNLGRLRDRQGVQDRQHRAGRGGRAADGKEEAMNPHERATMYRRYLIDQFESPDEELKLLNDVLNGRLHLIELEVVKEEMDRAREDSYAGVYGSFCRLNFAAHKANPSSGTSDSFTLYRCVLGFSGNFGICTAGPSVSLAFSSPGIILSFFSLTLLNLRRL